MLIILLVPLAQLVCPCMISIKVFFFKNRVNFHTHTHTHTHTRMNVWQTIVAGVRYLFSLCRKQPPPLVRTEVHNSHDTIVEVRVVHS